MTLVWTREQRATIAAMERWRLPTAYVPAYAPRDVELTVEFERRAAARERCRRRRRLAHQLAIAIGWYGVKNGETP